MKSKKDIEMLVKLLVQLKDACLRIDELGKKRPNDALNKFKLGFFNDLLRQANELMPAEYLPNADFRLFEEDSLPTNSDVVIMLSQYLACLRKFGRDNVQYESY
jgi:hypothetical protein